MNCPVKNSGLEIHPVGNQVAVFESDGAHTVEQIAELVREVYGLAEPPHEQVSQFLADLKRTGIVK